MRRHKSAPWGIFAIAFSVLLSLFTSGCGHVLDKSGPYAGDQILYSADQTIATTYDVLDAFLAWERANEAFVSADVHQAAEDLRKSAPGWFQSATTLRAAYALDPTPENRLKLQNALGILRAALNEATRYMIAVKKLAVHQPLFILHRLAA